MALTFITFLVCLFVREITGHGYMLDPPGRSSAWRFFENLPINYDDNALFCGGFTTQWNINGGLCGVCGDSYSDPHPQDNENTGKYGTGFVVATYEPGSVIDTRIVLTANHNGSFNYSLCFLENPNAPESGETCFKPLTLESGEYNVMVNSEQNEYHVRVQLPNFICERCVLRWTYKAATNWGPCDDGTFANGCGPQEHFRSCADISIYKHTIV